MSAIIFILYILYCIWIAIAVIILAVQIYRRIKNKSKERIQGNDVIDNKLKYISDEIFIEQAENITIDNNHTRYKYKINKNNLDVIKIPNEIYIYMKSREEEQTDNVEKFLQRYRQFSNSNVSVSENVELELPCYQIDDSSVARLQKNSMVASIVSSLQNSTRFRAAARASTPIEIEFTPARKTFRQTGRVGDPSRRGYGERVGWEELSFDGLSNPLRFRDAFKNRKSEPNFN